MRFVQAKSFIVVLAGVAKCSSYSFTIWSITILGRYVIQYRQLTVFPYFDKKPYFNDFLLPMFDHTYKQANNSNRGSYINEWEGRERSISKE